MFNLALEQQTALTDTSKISLAHFFSHEQHCFILPVLCYTRTVQRREDARFESTLQPWPHGYAFLHDSRSAAKTPPFSGLLTCQGLHQYDPAVAVDGATTAETARKVSVLHAFVQYESRNDTYLSHCFLGRHFPPPHRDTLERTRMIMNAPSCA